MTDTNDIIHLLRRTEFTARPARVAALSAMATLEDAVDDVLDFGMNSPFPALPGMNVHDIANRWSQHPFLHDWWIEAMVHQPRPFHEKMTLFWHGHFTTEWSQSERNDLMMRQNQLYRDHALGNFRTLTQLMSIEPAMLRYLSNASNVKGAPNENFARELLELFTLGVGQYSEDDVRAAARAWTGHNYNWSTDATYTFYPQNHDTGLKTFFGTTRNWDGPEIIDEILRDNVAKQLVAAKFIVAKLWRFLADQAPSTTVIDDLAALFVSSGMELRPVVRALLLRPEFYSTQVKQGMVRSPVEWTVAVLAHTGLTSAATRLFDWAPLMGQRVFSPPNVAGWKHNEYFLSTAAVSARANWARRVVTLLRASGGFDHLGSLSNAAAVDEVAEYFGIAPLAPTTRQVLISSFQAETTAVGGSVSTAISNLLLMAMLTGEMNAPC